MTLLEAGAGDVVTNVIGVLLDKGIVGVFAAVFLVLYLRKDKELTDERNARIADSKEGLTLALSIQEKVQMAIGKLGDMFEESRKLLERFRGGKAE